MKIVVILCGGTIEKTYSETREITSFANESNFVIEDIFKKHIRPKGLYLEFVRVLQKDSLDMDDEDRSEVLQACKKADTDKVIVVHGTSTMTNTAEVLMKDKSLQNKAVVITGAMRPYLLQGNADSVANISSALTAVQLLQSGVFIAMNGQIFKAGKVVKNEKIGIFESHI